jgi:hypothetical protein
MVNSKLDEDGVPTDGLTSFQTRRSMQSRRSSSSVYFNGNGDREGLIHAYDAENGIGMNDLVEANEGEPGPTFQRTVAQTVMHTKRNSQL